MVPIVDSKNLNLYTIKHKQNTLGKLKFMHFLASSILFALISLSSLHCTLQLKFGAFILSTCRFLLLFLQFLKITSFFSYAWPFHKIFGKYLNASFFCWLWVTQYDYNFFFMCSIKHFIQLNILNPNFCFLLVYFGEFPSEFVIFAHIFGSPSTLCCIADMSQILLECRDPL